MTLVTLTAQSLAPHGLVVACVAYLLSTAALRWLLVSRSRRIGDSWSVSGSE
jgi:hypothetical protein